MSEFLQILSGGVLVGATYALVALGLYLVYRVTGVVNLAQGAFCVVGALAGYSCTRRSAGTRCWRRPARSWPHRAAGAALGALTFVPGLSRLSNGSMLMLSAGLLTLIGGRAAGRVGQPALRAGPVHGGRPGRLGPITVPLQALWVLGTARP